MSVSERTAWKDGYERGFREGRARNTLADKISAFLIPSLPPETLRTVLTPDVDVDPAIAVWQWIRETLAGLDPAIKLPDDIAGDIHADSGAAPADPADDAEPEVEP